MKKNLCILAIYLAAMFLAAGCVGTQWVAEKDLGDVKAYQFGRTGVFGTDHSGTVLVENQPPQPDIYRLQNGSTTTTETTTTFSRCKERKEGRLTQAYFVGEEKKTTNQSGFQDVVNPKRAPWAINVGGSNPSTGNLAVPAAISGGSYVAGNAFAPGINNVVSAVGQGGKAQQWQSQKQKQQQQQQQQQNQQQQQQLKKH